MYGFVLWSSASICVCSAKSFVHPGRKTWGWYYQALINLTAEDNLEYLIFGSNWRNDICSLVPRLLSTIPFMWRGAWVRGYDVWIFYVVATGYHPRRKCCSLWSTHVNIPLMVSTQINVFNEAGEVEETLACNWLSALLVWFFIQFYPFFLVSYWQQPQMRIITYQSAGIPCTLHLAPCTLYLAPCTKWPEYMQS